jgi:hypothetical protein
MRQGPLTAVSWRPSRLPFSRCTLQPGIFRSEGAVAAWSAFHRPPAGFVQVRLHLPTCAGLEDLPQPGVPKAADHGAHVKKRDTTCCQLCGYTSNQGDLPGAARATQDGAALDALGGTVRR